MMFGIEFADTICRECLNRIMNCDPNNMGWSETQDKEWRAKFERYTENMIGVVITTDGSEDDEDGYFTRYGCPICADGLGNTVYPVIVLAEGYAS